MTNAGQTLAAIDSATQSDAYSTESNPFHHLASEVKHNLEHQHDWSLLQIHTHAPTSAEPLPRPIISGVPPRRIYIHPDEQLHLIKAKIEEQNVKPEREWVLPSHIREKWTLSRLAQIFDAIDAIPPGEQLPQAANYAIHDASPWRKVKRLLFATVDPDSTVTYYVVHDGIVKPRQN